MISGALETLSSLRTQIVLLATLIYFSAARAVFGGLDRGSVLLGAALFILLQAGYAYDKFSSPPEDRLNGVLRVRGFNWPLRLLLLSLAPALWYIASFEPLRWILALLAVVAPLYAFGIGRFRLKAIPALKPVLNTALLFSVSILPPILIKYGAGWHVIGRTMAAFWPPLVLIFSVTVMLDIRDVAGDRGAGVMTIPVMLGEDVTVLALGGGLAITAFAGFKAGCAAIVAPSLIIAAFLVPARRIKDRGYYELLLLALNMFLSVQWLLG